MKLESLYQSYLGSQGVTIDTREDPEGRIFFALQGETRDGNRFAVDALERGAQAAVVDDPDIKEEGAVLVEDALKTLQDLARYHRQQLKIPIIAITGSNGKTTTKELCSKVLGKRFERFATQGNLNNYIGLPLSVLAIEERHEIALLEFGADRPGENRLLADICDPTHGSVTNIGLDHLEGFGDREGVFYGNKELIDHLAEKGGHAFINADDADIMAMKEKGLKVSTYGSKGEVDLKGSLLRADPFLKVEWEGRKGERSSFNTSLIGSYNFPNVLAALCIGDHFGVDGQSMETAIANYQPDNLRSQVLHTEHNTILLDAYNANPTSMEAAIDSFTKMEAEPKGFILGDMLEMGSYEKEVHERIVELLQKEGLTDGFLVGKAFQRAAKGTGIDAYESLEEAKEALKDPIFEGHTILVKGSRGLKLEELLDFL